MTKPARRFDLDWREDVVLADGRPARLRLVRPTDRGLLTEGFAGMSERSRYLRFHEAKRALNESELRYLTELDHERHLALGAVRATEDGGEIGLGVARYVCLPDAAGTAEVALAVRDDAQGLGLGTVLLLRLVAAARERGVERLRFEVLGENDRMLNLLDDLAPDHPVRHEAGVEHIEVPVESFREP